MDDFDAADVANGIHELYEPLAEDDGMTLRVKAAPAPLHGNRELISQALANLVENAIKYGKPAPAAAAARRGCRRRRQGNPDRGAARGRYGAAQRHRSWPRHSRRRPQARGRAFRAAGGEPDAARLRPWAESGVGGCDVAWRRTAGSATRIRASSRRWRSRRSRSATGLRLKHRMCHRRWHDLIRAGQRGRHAVWPRASWTDRMSPRPIEAEQRLNDWLAELEPAQSAALDALTRPSVRQAHPARASPNSRPICSI